MTFNTVVNDMIELCENNLKSSCNGYLNVHQQMQDMMNSLFLDGEVFYTKQGNEFIKSWIQALDGAFTTMQTFNTELFDEMKKPSLMFNTTIGNMWRQFGLATLDETRTLHDQIEQLKIQLTEFQKRNSIREIEKQLEKNKGELVVKEDLKPFDKAFTDLRDTMDSVGDMDALRLTVAQLEKDLGKYMDEIAQVKELVGQINPKISNLATSIDRLANYAGDPR